MIRIPVALHEAICRAAEQTYPDESCGLLAGRKVDGDTLVTRVVPSPNVATGDHRDSFEVDPQVRFDLMRELEASDQDEQIVGHFHSHPNHPAEPSERDLAMAYEPDLVWIIASVTDGRTEELRAHQPAPDASHFTEIPLHITDG